VFRLAHAGQAVGDERHSRACGGSPWRRCRALRARALCAIIRLLPFACAGSSRRGEDAEFLVDQRRGQSCFERDAEYG
jgi:hypothetical protein